jgi:hypothetical protein
MSNRLTTTTHFDADIMFSHCAAAGVGRANRAGLDTERRAQTAAGVRLERRRLAAAGLAALAGETPALQRRRRHQRVYARLCALC